MRRTKEQKGITLIALIITIVVLLILAVVAINSIQNDGILAHAGNTANTYNQAVLDEQQQLQNYLDYLNEHSGPKTYDEYSIGAIVALKANTAEEFYVLEASDKIQKNVLLLAKECINTTDLTQGNADEVKFSTEVYWSAEYTTIEETIFPIPESHIAAKAAYDYGTSIGGTGRLITQNEMGPLYNVLGLHEMPDYGWVCTSGRIQAEYDEYFVYCFDKTSEGGEWYHNSFNYVRPVVEISKDLIQAVK